MPKYLTIAGQIEQQIVDYTLRPGCQLPTEKELMQRYAVSRQTVRNALSYLSKKDLIYTVKGAGTFVSNKTTSCTNSRNVAVLITGMDNYIFPYKSAGINSVLTSQGYVSNIFLTNNQIDKEEEAIRTILSSNFAGVILEISRAIIPRGNDLLAELNRTLPVILIDGYYPQFPNIPYVALDDRKGGYKATEYLIQHGHEKIFHLGKVDDLQGLLRYQGYVDALNAYHLEFSEDRVFWLPEELYSNLSEQLLDSICSKLEKCTAVFFYNDQIAASILPELLRRGVKIPDDLSIVSYDNSPQMSQFPVSLTCIGYPLDDLGKIAAEQLLKRMKNPNQDVTYIFQPEMIERASVRDLNTR
ncbi:MAG: GntR family transcriptional regulator [Butyricicoccus sp.]